jgi:hypothetical protein
MEKEETEWQFSWTRAAEIFTPETSSDSEQSKLPPFGPPRPCRCIRRSKEHPLCTNGWGGGDIRGAHTACYWAVGAPDPKTPIFWPPGKKQVWSDLEKRFITTDCEQLTEKEPTP